MLTAIIEEAACVGCGICVDVCPFDAIIGTCGQVATVLGTACIGCKLCITPCPVDCISMQPYPNSPASGSLALKSFIAKAKQRRAAKQARLATSKIQPLANKATINKDLKQIL